MFRVCFSPHESLQDPEYEVTEGLDGWVEVQYRACVDVSACSHEPVANRLALAE